MNYLDLESLKQKLQRLPVRQAYLFGSHAHGTAGPLSDVDIALVYAPLVNKEQVESQVFATISQILETDNIDLIDIETASPLLAHRAVLCGKAILNHSRHEEAVLKTKILHAYEDTRHLREIKEQAVL